MAQSYTVGPLFNSANYRSRDSYVSSPPTQYDIQKYMRPPRDYGFRGNVYGVSQNLNYTQPTDSYRSAA